MDGKEVKPIPEGYQTMTPYLTVRDAARTIEFYKEAFGAQERYRMPTPDGKGIAHAELKIGDSIFMLSDEMPGMGYGSPLSLGGTAVGFYVYVEDVDAAFDRAIAAGGTVRQPVQDMFWGDRTGSLQDPFGHKWDLATRVEDVRPDEMKRRGAEFFRKMGSESS